MSNEYQFSEFETDLLGMKFDGDETYETMECIGSTQEELEVRIRTKKCRGNDWKVRVRGTGNGELTITGHIPWGIYQKAYGMRLDSLLDGVLGYGYNSVHPGFGATQRTYNEDDEVKYKAYPRCRLESGISRKIENGADEVAEIELKAKITPDEYGQGMYECLEKDLPEGITGDDWMKSFDPSMVQVKEA